LLAGALSEVLDNKPRVFAASESVPKIADGHSAETDEGGSQAANDLTGIDLLSPAFEPFRVVLTRTLKMVRPELYDLYRRIKDSDSPASREDAYAFAFGVLAKLIEKQTGT